MTNRTDPHRGRSSELETVLDVDNPRLLRVEFHSQFLQDSKRHGNGRVRLGL